MGIRQYEPLAALYDVPIVVTGFEPLDVLDGIRRAIVQLESGRAEVENAYERAVQADGNQPAQSIIAEVFTVCDRRWRGVGSIPSSGWRVADAYANFDAELRFDVGLLELDEPAECRAGEVLQGIIKPDACEAFGVTCTPRSPLGALMVSSEGACAAYFHYRRSATNVGI
jgi:hydrogenase expression/formation protein HypD